MVSQRYGGRSQRRQTHTHLAIFGPILRPEVVCLLPRATAASASDSRPIAFLESAHCRIRSVRLDVGFRSEKNSEPYSQFLPAHHVHSTSNCTFVLSYEHLAFSLFNRTTNMSCINDLTPLRKRVIACTRGSSGSIFCLWRHASSDA